MSKVRSDLVEDLVRWAIVFANDHGRGPTARELAKAHREFSRVRDGEFLERAGVVHSAVPNAIDEMVGNANHL